MLGSYRSEAENESKAEQTGQTGQVPPSSGSGGVRSYSYELKEDPRYAHSEPVAPQSDDTEKVPLGDDAVFPSPVTGEPGPGEVSDGTTLKDQANEGSGDRVRYVLVWLVS